MKVTGGDLPPPASSWNIDEWRKSVLSPRATFGRETTLQQNVRVHVRLMIH